AAADQPQSEPHQRAQHRRHDGVQPQRPTEAQVEEAELDRVGVLDHEDDQRGQAEQGGDGPATEPPSVPSLLGHDPPSGISSPRTWSTRDPVDHAGAACRTATRRRDDGVVTRDSHTAEQDELWDRLREVVGPAHVLTDPEVTASYLTDWTGRFRGRARCVVLPAGTGEVAGVMAACAAAGAPVVVQGGNTGLVGGATPMAGEVLLSLVRLTDLGPVDRVSGQVVAGAG